MNDDYAKATAAPGFIRIGDVDYRAGKFGPRDVGDLEAWLKSQIPDPRLMARELCAGLSDAVALEVWRDLSDEAKDWPPDIMSRQGNKLLMQTWEGNALMVWVSFRRHNASFTLEEARAITKRDDEIVNEVIKHAFPEPTFDPKAPPTTTSDQE